MAPFLVSSSHETFVKKHKRFGGVLYLVQSGRLALRNRVKEENYLEIYGRLREDMGMKTYLHGPMDYLQTLKVRFRLGGPGPTRKQKEAGRRTWLQICARVAQQQRVVDSLIWRM